MNLTVESNDSYLKNLLLCSLAQQRISVRHLYSCRLGLNVAHRTAQQLSSLGVKEKVLSAVWQSTPRELLGCYSQLWGRAKSFPGEGNRVARLYSTWMSLEQLGYDVITEEPFKFLQ